MKIALIGYGKMGRTIEKMAIAQGNEVTIRLDKSTHPTWEAYDLRNADVAIEFSQPEGAYENIMRCFEANVPVVCGTTGWLDKMPEVQRICREMNQSFFYASNYSIGVNIFFEINLLLAKLMNEQENYDEVIIHEVHHLQKLDSPSGTAITVAEQILEKIKRLKGWANYRDGENISPDPKSNSAELPIFSSREDDIPGTHIVKYFSSEDEIEIIHKAFNREGFAKGALAAALWLKGKKGCYSMKDLLSL